MSESSDRSATSVPEEDTFRVTARHLLTVKEHIDEPLRICGDDGVGAEMKQARGPYGQNVEEIAETQSDASE